MAGTILLMEKIDEAIKAYGGCPGAFMITEEGVQ
jgi:hypothetical protein